MNAFRLASLSGLGLSLTLAVVSSATTSGCKKDEPTPEVVPPAPPTELAPVAVADAEIAAVDAAADANVSAADAAASNTVAAQAAATTKLGYASDAGRDGAAADAATDAKVADAAAVDAALDSGAKGIDLTKFDASAHAAAAAEALKNAFADGGLGRLHIPGHLLKRDAGK